MHNKIIKISTFGTLFTAKISSIFEPTSITLPPLTTPAFLKVISSRAIPFINNFCADSGTPHILSKCAFNSNTDASYAKVMSCLTLLKTTVNSICSGISQTSDSSTDSEEHAVLSVGASVSGFSAFGLHSSAVFVPFDSKELGSQFSVESPFSEAGK